MSSTRELFAEALRQHTYSLTKPRLAVFNALLGEEPVSMRELGEKVPSIDRASVYRTVSLLEELGIILRINVGWKYKLELSEMFSTHHHHISCTACGKIVALNERALERVIDRLSALHGFIPAAHQIEIQGLCSNCQKASQSSQR
ncbi:MAG TPA: Fur family transcriptional regulator [Candidatus Saccharimonadales bacterium]|nr:Fur family transcriptional regulator [Candidatus Saccharimonadales bacterium]